jgi:hypothetical protein
MPLKGEETVMRARFFGNVLCELQEGAWGMACQVEYFGSDSKSSI